MNERHDWIFTFGSSHLLGSKRHVRLNDMECDESREFMHSMVGSKWSMQYKAEEWDNKYKTECVLTFNRDQLPDEFNYDVPQGPEKWDT